jgi:hypothetical protein
VRADENADVSDQSRIASSEKCREVGHTLLAESKAYDIAVSLEKAVDIAV